MIATPQQSLEAAAEVAKAAGVTPLLLGDAWKAKPPRSASSWPESPAQSP